MGCIYAYHPRLKPGAKCFRSYAAKHSPKQPTKEIAATGSAANGADFVSGTALATGDCQHKDKKTPAASAVPLTEASFRPRSPDQHYSFACSKANPQSALLFSRAHRALANEVFRRWETVACPHPEQSTDNDPHWRPTA